MGKRSFVNLTLFLVFGFAVLFSTAVVQNALAQSAGSSALTAADDTNDPGSSTAGNGGLLDLDIEQLRSTVVSPALETEITTVSRTAQPLSRTAAAVYVITNEMIKRSGAKTLPDVLRTAPGVNVAKISGTAWAVSIRGFNSEFGNKILVQIDGRAVYTQTFSGVFWDQERVMLEDVDRIEIIRGPGASVWGANAVNGIINIITKSAKDTTGLYAEVGGGSELRTFSNNRIGGRIGKNAYYRIYGMHLNNDAGYKQPMRHDDHRHGQTGARIDWTPTCRDTFTVEGDYLDGYSGPGRLAELAGQPDEGENLRRANALLRWTREVNCETKWSFQTYYNHFTRSSPAFISEDVFDVDWQIETRRWRNHEVVAGFGYRLNKTAFSLSPSAPLAYDPELRTFNKIGCFIQDTITLVDDRIFLTLGTKLSRNDFTGFEYQPTAKIAWTPNDRTSIWGSVARAVRTPSVVEQDISTFKVPFGPGQELLITGNKNQKSEEAITYELGIRRQPTERLYWDMAFYFSRYDKLTTTHFEKAYVDGGTLILLRPTANGGMMDTYGFELASTYEVSDWWRLSGSYTFFVEEPRVPPDDAFFITEPGRSPRNMAYLQSSFDISCTTTADLMFRYVDSLKVGAPSYLVMDVRLGWEPRRGLEFSVVGRNLLGARRYEIVRSNATQIEQEVYGYVSWNY